MIDLDDELAQDYLADSTEHLGEIEAELLTMQTGGAGYDATRLNRVFRATHSIWGGAAFFDLTNVRELTSKMEAVLSAIRAREKAPTPHQASILLSATVRLSQLLLAPVESNKANIADVVDLLENLPLSETHTTRVPVVSRKSESHEPLRFLLAEDDLACRLLLRTFLSRYGECNSAVNGVETVESFRMAMEEGRPYDLICMDIMMPEMNGREAVRQVRALEEEHGILSTSGVKIVMTTTVDEVKEVFLCFQELCDAYLMKPIDLAELLRQMRLFHLIAQ